ncbi:hypothetical protein [Methylorubrum extorquens]|uniref:Uncharacterized protein n=1 Tax=Methylorubrum extorquens DSM 13060 TaxID=882800 RepID=H1KE91_METEX|nr:hypothetical protein [Methylorubrum extorquens]EHP94208.1 hypothetical protein MetexDRAFT_0953 [Methylorubrum extorquens DSM 13060]
MRREMLELLNTLASGVIALNTLADDLVQAAATVDDASTADLLRSVACQHRVRALEMQGQLAILSTEYAERFHTGS